MDEGFILVGAGGETTAQTLAVLTFHLLNNPESLLELRAELDQVMPDPESSVPWQTLEQLPLMVRRTRIDQRWRHDKGRLAEPNQRAVITEAHRISAAITSRLIRIAPTEVLRFRDLDIPAGVSSSLSDHSPFCPPFTANLPVSFSH